MVYTEVGYLLSKKDIYQQQDTQNKTEEADWK